MTLPRLSIAYGDEQSRRSAAVAEILQGLGHEVVRHDDENGFLAAPEPDLYLLGPVLADGTRGLELLESLRRTGRSAPIVMLHENPSFEEMRHAVELGASDMVVRPQDASELTRALARAHAARAPRPRAEVQRTHGCVRTYSSDATSVGRAAREISAFLVNEGVVNAHRVRIASALAELVDNACRHAYPDRAGEIVVRAEVQQ